MEKLSSSMDRLGMKVDKYGVKIGKKMDSLGEKLTESVQKKVHEMEKKFSKADLNEGFGTAMAAPMPAPVYFPPHAVYDAASSGDRQTLERLLRSLDSLPSAATYLEHMDVEERTPLLVACSNGHVECAKLLLDHDANHVAVDADGNTALHLACVHGQVPVVVQLFNHPTRRCTPYILNKKGMSALRLARVVVQAKQGEWINVAKAIEVLEQRCKVFEGWIYHRSQSMFTWQSWESRYALILRTGSSLYLEMHLFDVKNGLRTPVPCLVFDIDVHKPVTLYREGDGANRKPLAIVLENQVLAAYNDAGFEAWSHFFTTQASLAVHDPSLSSDVAASTFAVGPTSRQGSFDSLPNKGKHLHQLSPSVANAPASAPTWDDDTNNENNETQSKQSEIPAKKHVDKHFEDDESKKDLEAISQYVGGHSDEAVASAPLLEDESWDTKNANPYATAREECVVCLDRSKQTVCVPCGHVAACVPCAEKLQRTTKRCPVCRSQVREIVKLFLA